MSEATICDGCNKRIENARCMELKETFKGVAISFGQRDAEALHFHGLECIQKWLDAKKSETIERGY